MRRQGKLHGQRSRPLHDARVVGLAQPAHGRVPGFGHAAEAGGRPTRQGHPDREQAGGQESDFQPAGREADPGQRPEFGFRARQRLRQVLIPFAERRCPRGIDHAARTPRATQLCQPCQLLTSRSISITARPRRSTRAWSTP
ncbi:hypothetical protein VARIO8X_90593 [Burkholderiales bacterium 8X]|nr:hypothetical protein VARIO8X_90593 [Burkholderiales bacterium 8X]